MSSYLSRSRYLLPYGSPECWILARHLAGLGINYSGERSPDGFRVKKETCFFRFLFDSFWQWCSIIDRTCPLCSTVALCEVDMKEIKEIMIFCR